MADKIDQDRKNDDRLNDEFGATGFDDFELDDPFGSLEGPSKGRKPDSPSKEMLISGLKGAGQGLSSGFKSELYKAMPAVEPVVGEITDSFNEFRDLKDEVGKKLAPMITTLETSARKILPKAQAFIPKGMYEKIKGKLDERAEARAAEAGYSQSKEQQESEYISQSLNEIFGAQMEAQQASDLAREQQHIADQAVEAERHESALAATGHVYESVRATELFHKTLHTAYLKKSLELKYKHLFIAKDTYNLLAESMKAFNGYLQAIQKNTMLPDMAKVEIGDYHRKAMTQKYGELMTNFMSSFRKKIFGAIKKKVLGAVSSFGDAADMLGQGVDMAEMAGEMGGGPSAKGMIGQGAGWLMGKLGGSPIFRNLAQKYAPILKSANKGVGGFANALALKGANLKRNWEASDSRVLQFFADFLPGLTPQTSGSNDLVDRGEKPATFDTMTRQSIVEIIPGYLSKILHSVDILRTGDENTEQQVYNVYSRKFTSVDELKEGYYDKLYGAESTRRSVFQDALSTLQAGVTNNKTAEDPKEYYKKYEKDINKFLLNHAIKAQFLDLKKIGEYLTRSDDGFVSQYILDITRGFENNPDDVLRAIYQGCLAEDGDVDKDLVQSLEESINAYRKMDSFKSEMPRLFELYGYRSYLSDKVTTKQRAALEKQIKSAKETSALEKLVKTDKEEADLESQVLDEEAEKALAAQAGGTDEKAATEAKARLEAAKKAKEELEKSRQAKKDLAASSRAKTELAAASGIIGDNNNFNLTHLVETQADIDYGGVDTEYGVKRVLDEIDTAKQARQQIAELKEKTGYNRMAKWVGEKKDAASAFGRKIMDQAKGKYDEAKTFLSDIASNFSNFATKIVTDPIYRAGILADLEAKGLDLLAAGKAGGEKVMQLAKEIREDPKAAMDKLRAASKEKFDEITEAVGEKLDAAKKKATEFYESHVSEETRDKISKGIDTATGAIKSAAEATGKVIEEHTPEGVKKVVKKVADAIPTSKEEVSELIKTAKDSVVETVKKIPTDKEGLAEAAKTISQTVTTKVSEAATAIGEAVDKHTPESVKKVVTQATDAATSGVKRVVKKFRGPKDEGGDSTPPPVPPVPPPPGGGGGGGSVIDDESMTVFRTFMDSCRDTLNNLNTQMTNVNDVLNVAFRSSETGRTASIVDAVMTVNQTLLDARNNSGDSTASVATPLPSTVTNDNADLLRQILEEYKFQSEFRTEQLDEWKKHHSEEMGIIFDTMAEWKGSQEELLKALTEKVGSMGGGGGGGDGNGFNHEALISALEQGGYIKKKGILQRIGGGLKSAGGVAGKAIKGVGKYAGMVYAGALKGAGHAIKGAFGFAGNALNKAASAAKWMVSKPTFVDIYRKGEEGGAPLVSARMQKEDPGVVFADNGERVKASKDINRPVKDPRTGNYLITVEDLQHGLSMPDGSPIGKLMGGAAKLLQSYFGVVGTAIAGAFKFAGGAVKTVSGAVFGKSAEPYCDIYLKDNMEKPILTRLKQARDPGVVFKDGTRVKYSSDIHEPVYDPVEKDAAGQPKELISEDDIKKGLVDANGKKLSMKGGTKGLIGATAGAIEKLAPILGKGLKGAGGLYATVFKGLFGLGVGAAKGVGKVLGRLFGLNTGGGTDVNEELLKAVQKIRDDVDILAEPAREKSKRKRAGDTDGDGDIDGTYADQQQNKSDEKTGPTFAEHVDVNYRKDVADGAAAAAAGGAAGGGLFSKIKDKLFNKLKDTKMGKVMKGWFDGAKGWTKNILKGFGSKLGGFTKSLGGKLGGMLKGLGGLFGKLPGLLGGAFKGLGGMLGKIPGLGKLGGVLGKIPGIGKLGGLAAKIPGVAGLAAKVPMLGSLFGAGSAAAGTAAAGTAAAGTAAAGTAAAGAAGAGALGTLGAIAGPAALAALAGYGIYRGVKGFSKKNTLENLGKSNGISKENQLTFEDRMYSALGMNSKIGAKAAKFLVGSGVLTGGIPIAGIIKGIRGNDNPLTDKEIENGRGKLQRKIDKGLPGYDRILQEYEKAVEAGNWRRARELTGQEADGLITSMWKNSYVGMAVSGLGKLIFGNKNEEMKKEEIEKVRNKFNSIIDKGGPKAKNAEKVLSKFEDYVAEGDWKHAREIAGMENRGLFGKLFQDSKGNVKWGKLALTAVGGIAGLGLGWLLEKKDENEPMSEKEVETERARLQKLADGGNKAAEKILEKFEEAVTEMNWKKARKLCGKEVQSNLVKFGKGVKSTVKWARRIGSLGLSMLFESDQDEPLKDNEIERYQKKMQARANHGDKMAEKKLDKFNEAVAKQQWAKAREIAKLPDEMAVTKAAKATWRFFFGGSGEEPMKEAEIEKFRESMQRKINMGSKAAEKKLEAFNQAVEEERWKKARAISKTPDEGILKKGAKAYGKFVANQFRFIFGGDGKPMDESELEKARKQFQIDIAEGKKGAQKRSDMFEDFVADEKWEKARKLAKMPYENVAKRVLKSVGSFLFGDDKEAMSPEEIDKFQKEMEQKVEDGVPGAQKQLDAFNHAVEIENWKKAREISKVKAGGVVGSIKNAAKSVWNFFTGKKDYEDCMKKKEELEEKASEDETGLVDAGITKFETLVRRQKYNEAMDLADDIMKLKPHELAMKHQLSSDGYEQFKKQAEELDKKIGKAIDSDHSWFSIKKMRLKMLRGDLKNSNEWSDEYFEELRDRYSRITGEDIFGADAEDLDEDTLKKGKQLLKDVDDTSNNFSWIGSPIIKSRLAALRSEIKGDLSAWDEEQFDEWRDKIKEIAGEDAVITRSKAEIDDMYSDPETLKKGRKLLDKLQEMKDSYSWWTSPLIKKNLQGLYDSLKGDPSSWSDETFKNIMNQAQEITGKSAEEIEKEIDADDSWKEARQADREGKQVLKDIDATANKFSWFGSPRIKWKLSRLRAQVEGEEMKWGKGDTIEQYRNRLKEIAGDDAVITDLPENDEEWEERERIERQGQQVIRDINATKEKFSWLGSPKIKWNLSRLKSQVEGEEVEWTSEKLEQYRKRIKEIAGDEAVITRNEDDMTDAEKKEFAEGKWVEDQGKQLIKDVDATKDKFSWLTSPRIKWNLSRLKSQIEGEEGEWNAQRFELYKARLREIAGDDAVITEIEKPGAEEGQEDKELEEQKWIVGKGKQLINDVEATKDKFSWLTSPRIKWNLSRLKSQIEGEEGEWTEQKFRAYENRLRDIAGDDAVITEVEKPGGKDEAEVAEQNWVNDKGHQLIKDVEATKDKFSWLTSPRIKWNLSRLKSQIEGEEGEWSEKKFEQYESRLKDIAGDDAVITDVEKPGGESKEDEEYSEQKWVNDKGKQLIKDVEETKDKFSWLKNPIIKWNLSRLKSRIEGEEGEWTEEKMKEYEDKLKDIAGDKAVITEVAKPEKAEEEAEAKDKLESATEEQLVQKLKDLKFKIIKKLKELPSNDNRVPGLEKLLVDITKKLNWRWGGVFNARLVKGYLKKYQEIMGEPAFEDEDYSDEDDGERTVEQRGDDLINDIEDTKSKIDWFHSANWELGWLKTKLKWGRDTWTKESIDKAREKYREICREHDLKYAKDSDAEAEEKDMDPTILAKGKSLIDDINDTKKEFHWWDPEPAQLDALRQQVEAKKLEWDDENLKEFKKKLKEIGKDKTKDSYNFDAADQDLERRGRQLVKDVDQTMENLGKNDFWKRWQNWGTNDKLEALKTRISANYAEWSDEKLKAWQDELKEIAGEAAVISDMSRKEEEDDDDLDIDTETSVVEQLEKLRKETSDSYKGLQITDPKVKQLDELTAEISHLQNNPEKDDDTARIKVARLRKKLDKILGRVKKEEEVVEEPELDVSDTDAVATENVEDKLEDAATGGYSNPLAEEHYGKAAIAEKPWLALVEQPGDPDSEAAAKQQWEKDNPKEAAEVAARGRKEAAQAAMPSQAAPAEVASEASGASSSAAPAAASSDDPEEVIAEDLGSTTMSGITYYKWKDGNGKIHTSTMSPQEWVKKRREKFKDRFASGGFFKKISNKFGEYVSKAKQAITDSGIAEIGEAGTEAILPIRNKVGNLLSKLGDKVNAIIHGENVGPAHDVQTDDGSLHAEDQAAEPVTNLMANELSKNITPKVIDKNKSGGWLDNVREFFKGKSETPAAAPAAAAPEAAPESDDKFTKVLEQNQQLISLLASIISDKGIKVDGMDDLATAVASAPSEGDTNNVNFNDNGGGQQTGFDLRKKQV